MSKKRHQTKRMTVQVHYGSILIGSTLTVFSLVLTFFALNYNNSNANSGYQLKNLENERSKVAFEIETLKMEIADLGSLGKNENSN
jgi:hypothetical protein